MNLIWCHLKRYRWNLSGLRGVVLYGGKPAGREKGMGMENDAMEGIRSGKRTVCGTGA